MGLMAGKRALVTGAGRGLGRAIALALAQAGADVALLARSEGELAEAAALVRAAGQTADTFSVDLSGSAMSLAASAEAIGQVDVLVNNAGIVDPVMVSSELDPSQWARNLQVNLVAAATLTFSLLPRMLEHRWGRIVNVSSGIVSQPTVMLRGNAYVTAKTALEAHTLNLAAEPEDTGVTVNAFRPGYVDTSQQAWLRAQGPGVIGAALHQRYVGFATDGHLVAPEMPAAILIARLESQASGQVWDVLA